MTTDSNILYGFKINFQKRTQCWLGMKIVVNLGRVGWGSIWSTYVMRNSQKNQNEKK